MMRQNPCLSRDRCPFPRGQMYQTKRRSSSQSPHCTLHSCKSDLRTTQDQDSVIGLNKNEASGKYNNLPSQCIDPFHLEYAQYRYYLDLPAHAVPKLHLKLLTQEGKPEHARGL